MCNESNVALNLNYLCISENIMMIEQLIAKNILFLHEIEPNSVEFCHESNDIIDSNDLCKIILMTAHLIGEKLCCHEMTYQVSILQD